MDSKREEKYFFKSREREPTTYVCATANLVLEMLSETILQLSKADSILVAACRPLIDDSVCCTLS